MFDSERKRELPLNPKTVGMITSPSGAAVRDMTTVARQRNRGIKLLLFPVKVQEMVLLLKLSGRSGL